MKEKLLEIINHYGVIPQLKYFQSEVFELNEAIIQAEEFKKYNNRYNIFNKTNIAEELADVHVMLTQIMLFYGIDSETIAKIMKKKTDRQIERIRNENN